MASLTGSGAKLDGGRHIARAAIRAEALAYGYIDIDALIMEGTYTNAMDRQLLPRRSLAQLLCRAWVCRVSGHTLSLEEMTGIIAIP